MQTLSNNRQLNYGNTDKMCIAKIKMSPDFSDELLKQSSRSYGMKKRCNE